MRNLAERNQRTAIPKGMPCNLVGHDRSKVRMEALPPAEWCSATAVEPQPPCIVYQASITFEHQHQLESMRGDQTLRGVRCPMQQVQWACLLAARAPNPNCAVLSPKKIVQVGNQELSTYHTTSSSSTAAVLDLSIKTPSRPHLSISRLLVLR